MHNTIQFTISCLKKTCWEVTVKKAAASKGNSKETIHRILENTMIRILFNTSPSLSLHFPSFFCQPKTTPDCKPVYQSAMLLFIHYLHNTPKGDFCSRIARSNATKELATNLLFLVFPSYHLVNGHIPALQYIAGLIYMDWCCLALHSCGVSPCSCLNTRAK
jgi:hypothetical protein